MHGGAYFRNFTVVYLHDNVITIQFDVFLVEIRVIVS